MKRTMIGTVAVLALFGAACSTGDDVSGVSELAGNESDESADSVVESDTTEPAETPTSEAPADTEPVAPVGDGFVFTAPTNDYVITFPGEPTSTPLPIPLPTGQVEAEAFIYEDGGDAAYFTSVFDYPDGVIDGDSDVVLTGARDGAVANVGGTLLDSEFVELDGIPGIAFTFAVADGATSGDGSALVFINGLRLYQSFALGFSGQTSEFEAFLDTFTFTATEGGS